MQTSEFHYEVVIRWSGEDEAYVARVPELPGCMADGPTYAAALVSIERVMGEWVETARELGREIPSS